MEGYVYAIENGDAVKIGFAKDPLRRLSELNVGSHVAHRLIGFAVGTRKHEAEMHALAANERIRGEWFQKGKVVSTFLDLIPKYKPVHKDYPESDVSATAVICRFGGITKLARELNLPVATVQSWGLRNQFPSKRVIDVERLTGVPRHDLRPDIYPPQAATSTQGEAA